MTVDINHIIICRTNIRTEPDRQKIRSHLDNHPGIIKWNLDLHDIDCVLRVVSLSLDCAAVISIIRQHGFDCAELD